jgi:hypothetical protein
LPLKSKIDLTIYIGKTKRFLQDEFGVASLLSRPGIRHGRLEIRTNLACLKMFHAISKSVYYHILEIDYQKPVD